MTEDELTATLAALYQSGVKDGVEMALRTLGNALDEILVSLDKNPPKPPDLKVV